MASQQPSLKDPSYLGFGLGLRAPHYEEVLRDRPAVDWFEILSENYMDAHEGYWDYLADVRAHYPLAMHGVALSIGSADPVDEGYLDKLKKLADFLEPCWVSDHLCFTGFGGRNTHDLLPVPYTQDMLNHVAARLHHAQDRLKRPLILENPSTYFEYQASTMTEWDFLKELARQTGCGYVLDVNNVYVSAFNHGFDPKLYIDALQDAPVAYIHLAGHSLQDKSIIDTHDAPVADPVWDLYAYTVRQRGLCSTMIEWDDAIPALAVLQDELAKARRVAYDVTAEAKRDHAA